MDYNDEETEDFYSQLQEVLDGTPKKDIIVVQGDWNAKIGKDEVNDWKGTCGPFCNTSPTTEVLDSWNLPDTTS